MKVIVTGGRDYQDLNKLAEVLDKIKPTLIIQGGATGADSLADIYALNKGIECKTYPANWSKHGRAAGPIRNREMLEANRDATVVAFPGGAGTRNCVITAKELGMKVIIV